MKLSEWVAAAASSVNIGGPQPAARRQVRDALRLVRGEHDPILFAQEDWPEEGVENPVLAETVWAALPDGLAVVDVNLKLNAGGRLPQGFQAAVEVRPWRAVELRLAGLGTTAEQPGEYTLSFGWGNPAKAEPYDVDNLMALWRECIQLAAQA
jgi:hypothetical protein